ncbi:MAG: hypothetical protein HQL58_12180 [Magnetococcales bacterium]|nr:hypothetical protein [Magnetococcales bacterium]
MVVEAKFTLKKDDLDDFIAKLPRVTQFFHEYRGMRILGAVTDTVVHQGCGSSGPQEGAVCVGTIF